ncbi:hypothetical protein [Infirmifilum sp. NZ]|uniref:hypothetical protein n=1 Tax=Infirmifilum sp. NZ TaxID=2926850 RepID=UPI0027AA73AC|nr:hypothetical protein [Infirmifilum sp. NZ]UNQ73753.1 hypothetical protein MOV14_01760 [Infirmifilum sp. NZ]
MSIRDFDEVDKAIWKYNKITYEPVFWDYVHKFSGGLREAIRDSSHEVDIVRKVVHQLRGFEVRGRNGVTLSTSTAFIHGKIMASFDFKGDNVRRELGDLIFILSVVYRNLIFFEKLTISQAKVTRNGVWDLSNEAQLYLLSRFPPFKISGRGREYRLPNYTYTLGSYTLFDLRENDLVYISARLLDDIVSANDSRVERVNREDLFWCDYYSLYLRYHRNWYVPWLLDLPTFIPPPLLSGEVLGVSLCSLDAFGFASNFLRGFVGEPAFSAMGYYNCSIASFLQKLISYFKGKKCFEDFVQLFTRYDYPYDVPDPEGIEIEERGGEGGTGIIYTVINLGE